MIINVLTPHSEPDRPRIWHLSAADSADFAAMLRAVSGDGSLYGPIETGYHYLPILPAALAGRPFVYYCFRFRNPDLKQ